MAKICTTILVKLAAISLIFPACSPKGTNDIQQASTQIMVLAFVSIITSTVTLLLSRRYFTTKIVLANNQKNKAQRSQQAAEDQLLLFAKMQQEFPSQMMLVIAPVEKLMHDNHLTSHHETFATIHKNAHRILYSLSQLSDYQIYRSKNMQFTPEQGEIVSHTQKACGLFEELLSQKHIRFQFNANTHERHLKFDHDKYTKIIYNLLDQAIRTTPEQGTISLDLNFTEGFTITQAQENTQPIPNGNLELRITSSAPHPQSTATISEIGLILAQEYTHLHSGHLTQSNSPEYGKQYKLHIPIYQATNEYPEKQQLVPIVENYQPKTTTPSKASPRTSTILIVEDNEELRYFLRDNLSKKYNIIEATDGEDGYNKALEHLPKLIITDRLMPKMNGILLCSKLKSHHNTQHIPVIILTAMHTDQQKLDGIEAGADDYISKPFSFRILDARITSLLDRQKKSTQNLSSKVPVEPKELQITTVEEKFITRAENRPAKTYNAYLKNYVIEV